MLKAAFKDRMRGVMWEEKYRGTLEDYPEPEQLKEKAAKRVGSSVTPNPETDWNLPPVGLGTFGWKYDPGIIEAVLEDGPILIDTAEGYGFGKVEQALGKALKNCAHFPFIASKVSRNHMSKQAVIAAARRSQDRIGKPLDLYQIHWPNPDVPIDETLDGFAALLEEGTILRVGVCNHDIYSLDRVRRLARHRGFRIESNQIRCNSIDPGNLEYLIPTCRSYRVKVIAYSPLAQGSLRRAASDSLRWVLAGGVSYVIPRTNNPYHARANLRLND